MHGISRKDISVTALLFAVYVPEIVSHGTPVEIKSWEPAPRRLILAERIAGQTRVDANSPARRYLYKRFRCRGNLAEP